MRIRWLALSVAASCSLALAQSPQPWADLTVNGTQNGTIVAQGRTIAWHGQGSVHAFNALTRSWRSLPAGPGATLRITNHWLLVQDGGSWHAYGGPEGQFVPLPVGANATIVNPPSQVNDALLLVIDGGTLWSFSGCTGGLLARPVTGNTTVVVDRYTALLSDGNLVSGLDAWQDQWHDLVLPVAANSVHARGVTGVAVAGGTVHGFSAVRRGWTSHPALGNSGLLLGHDWAAWQVGTQALAFSAPAGSFAMQTTGAVLGTRSTDHFVLFDTATSVQAFSALNGNWAATPRSGTGALSTSDGVALLLEPAHVAAYSAARGTWTVQPFVSSGGDVSGSLAYVIDSPTGQPLLFSALTGSFHNPPADVMPGAPLLSTTAALLTTTTGFRAFGARGGTFAALASTGAPSVDRNSAVLAVAEANRLSVYEDRLGTWRSVVTNGAANVAIWRTTMIADDAAALHAHGTQAGDLHTQALPEPVLGRMARSECGYYLTANHVLAFSSLPQIGCNAQFPDFRRALLPGATVDLVLPVPVGAMVTLGAGRRAAVPLPVPGLGDVLVDPNTLVLMPWSPAPGARTSRLSFPLPATAALRGTDWWAQALIAPAAGAPWLTDATSLQLP